MQEPSDDIPDYLPDGTVNIHGKLAHKFRINIAQDSSGNPTVDMYSDKPTDRELKKRATEDMNKAFNGK